MNQIAKDRDYNLIVFKNLWFWREDQPVLKEINFEIKSNERVAILGPSGVGKTTILKLILGLIHPDFGQVLINNVDLSKASEDKLDLIRLKFSIVFQEGALFDSLSVKENVAFYFKEHTNMTPAQINESVLNLLKTVDLLRAADLMPEQLSVGMKRRVAIARSLAVSESMMNLYDEPTTGLDPVNSEIIRNLIVSLAVNGRGLIVVTHELFDALFMADRFMFLKDGQILFDGSKEEFLHSSESHVIEYLNPYRHFTPKF
jgi:phospholipid/cholesterol/gamma-HCH transport system ATP-binding protein